MPVIVETFALAADNTDILAAPSRLAAMPSDGTLVIEMSATEANGSNYGTVTIQLPDGSVPIDGQVIPANGMSTADGVIHDETALTMTAAVEQGGHVTIAYDETGTVAEALFICTLQF